MSNYGGSFEFISLDGAQSGFDISECYSWFKSTDHIIPQGKQIRTVETMLLKFNGNLLGFKWFGDDGVVLVAAGLIDIDDYRNASHLVLQSFTLNHNQRLVGVKSYSRGWKHACHYSF